MGNNPILDSADTIAKPAAFVAEFIRSHKAMDEVMQRVWERALADSIARPNVVRFEFVAPAPRAVQAVSAAQQPSTLADPDPIRPIATGVVGERFSDAGTHMPTTRSGGRRPKSAKARNRGGGT